VVGGQVAAQAVVQHGRIEYDPVTQESGRSQIFRAMEQTDILLIVHGQSQVCNEYIPSKLYEYLLTERPLLGIVAKESELEAILIENGHMIAEYDNIEDVKQKIISFIQTWEESGLPNHSKISPYTIESAVKNLIECANHCISKNQAELGRY